MLDAARGEIGKPYSGPLVGQPESFRWGDPGWDCSSFVAGAYARFGVCLTAYTDAIYDQTDPIAEAAAVPGDIVLYRYDDPGQPGCRFPHTGLWLSTVQTLDCRWPAGVEIRGHLVTAREIRRVRG